MSGLASFAFGSINLHQKLRSAERRAAALNMTAAMAHHINNPLQGAMFALFRLRSEGNLDETSLELLDIAETELARVAALSSDLLRGDEIKPAYVKGVPNSSQLNLELLR
jgi:signal transduction histidine kinase